MSAEEERLVEDESAKEEKKIVPATKAKDDDLPPLDSSDEGESDSEEDTYQEDGFVVADASDEDLPDVGEDDEGGRSRSRLKRLRKGGKRKRLELDQEDLDLVAANQGLAPTTKLRKTVADSEGSDRPSSISIAKADSSRESRKVDSTFADDDEKDVEEDANSEDDDFLVDDSEDENEDAATRKQRRKERKDRQNLALNYEQYEDATAIYNDEWLQDLYDPDGEGLFDDSEWGTIRTEGAEGAEHDKFAAYKKMYEPEMLKELYLTEKDEAIRTTDVPERFQLAYPNRAVPSEDEIREEAAWVHDRLFTSSNSMMSGDATMEEKINALLTLYLSSHYEMPFIEHYRKEFWAPTLSSTDLWRIVELDHQWHNLKARKQALLASLPDEDTIAADLKLIELRTKISIVQTEEAVQDLADYYAYHYGVSPASHTAAAAASATSASAAPAASLEDVVDDEVDVEKIANPSTGSASNNATAKKPAVIQKRPVRADVKTLAKEHKLDALWLRLGTKPADLAKAIMGSYGDGGSVNLSTYETETPLEVAETFISKPTFGSAQSVLDGSRALFAAELSVQPSFRARLAEYFDLHAVVSTKATPHGKLYIDLHHPFANVRHLKNKPVGSFRDSAIFLQILKAVEEGLIQVAISLPKDQVDTLVAQIGGAAFNLEALATYENNKDSANYLWAAYRRQILLDAVQLFLPKLISRCKAKLHKDATQVVLNETEQTLEKMIRVGPLHVPSARVVKRASSGKKSKGHHPMLDDEEESAPPIISICVGDPTQSREVLAMIAVVDEGGELRDTLSILASLRVEDSIAVRELFRKHMPFAVAVGVDTPLAKTFYSKIKELVNSFVAEESLDSPIRCIPVPLDIAVVFQATKHAEKEFDASAFIAPTPEAGLMLRRCTSAARRLLDPLSEIAGLFTQHDYILGLDLHPLRKLVNQPALKRRLETAFIRVVSEVGVDLNRILEHSWMQSTLQFVAGLGPRKAAALLEGLMRTSDSPVESRNQLKDSAENSQLRNGEYLGPVVWDNAAAFLKVASTYSRYIRDWNPLDGTRIHPVAYAIAKKIGDDLVASNHVKAHESYVSAISRDPLLLRYVDLQAMIDKLNSKNVNKEATVRALAEELKAPFADPRVYSEFSMSSIFDLVVGKGSMDVGMIVTVRVTWQDRQTFTWEVSLPNHLTGTIAQTDAPEKLTRGQNVQAQILGVDKELFKCQLTCNLGSSTWNANEVLNKDPWLADEDIDLSEAAAALAKAQPTIVTRKFVHRHFSNKTRVEAEEFLASKPVGAYLIHPTAKKNYLSITSKFFFDTFARVSVEEQEDGTLKIDKESYENLDDLVVRFMEPMLINMKELEQHACFKLLNKAEMLPFIQEEKRTNPKRSPYHIAPSLEKPGFFVLYYIPGSTTVQKEYVHVVADGFKYRSIIHKSVNRLIAYFKAHFNDQSYLQQQQQRNARPSGGQGGAHGPQHPYPAYQAPQWPAPQHYPPPMHTGMGYGVPQQY